MNSKVTQDPYKTGGEKIKHESSFKIVSECFPSVYFFSKDQRMLAVGNKYSSTLQMPYQFSLLICTCLWD